MALPLPEPGPDRPPEFLRPLPARERLRLPPVRSFGPPPLSLRRVRPAPTFRIAVRTARWALALARFAVEVLFDRLRGDRSHRQLGRRFRATFQRIGGTAITVGQEIAMRMDLLPIAVCDELAHLQDSGPAMPIEVALAQIEKGLGRPARELFTRIDPVPISTNVTACMFQAETTSGKVVIQVRRPGIERALDADIEAVSGLLLLAEQLTIVPPGRLRALRENLRDMIVEELDFAERARHQEVFRRLAKKAGLKRVTSPRIARNLVGREVSVNDFVGGVYLAEVIEAKESGDERALEDLRSRGIVPEELAREIQLAFWWSLYEAPFFYADPHPSNMVVHPGGVVKFIDWPKCGSVAFRLRVLHRRITTCLWEGRVSEAATLMVQTLLPLPRLNVHDFTKELEQRLWDSSQAMRHAGSSPWERTTAGAWIALLAMARSFSLAVDLDVLRMIHASLHYDAVVSRLSDRLDRGLFRRYEKDAARRRVEKAASGFDPGEVSLLVEVDALADRLDEARTWVEGAMASMPANHLYMSSKASYVADVLIRYLAGVSWILAGAVGAIGLHQLITGEEFSILDGVRAIAASPPFLGFLAIASVITIRRILFRIQDVDVDA